MAYGDKYISSLFTRNGHTHRLIIAEKDYTGASKTLEGIKGIWLEVQGSSDPIESPIVKTNLSWTVTDAPDMNTASEKWGGWEELFTPDALKYRVQLLRDNALVWSGFITPDSWSEDLEYHAPLNFTARDLIGHLSDFDFDPADVTRDADGLSSVKDLMTAAWSKASIPMTLSVFDKTKWLQAGSNNGYEDFLVDLSLFEDKTWYQVVEDTLASMGLILRYTGSNTLWLAPLRFLPYCGSTSLATRKNAVLLNRSGVRTIDLAYKQIIETGNYEIYADDVMYIADDEWAGNPKYINKTGWYSLAGKVLPLTDNLVPFSGGGEPQKGVRLYQAASSAESTVTLRHRYIVATNTPIKVSATFDHILCEGGTAGTYYSRDTNTGFLGFWETIRVNWRLRLHPHNGLGDVYLSDTGEWTAVSSSATDWTGQIELSNKTTNVTAQTLGCKCVTPDTEGDLYWECAVAVWTNRGITTANNTFTLLSELTFAVDGAVIPRGWKVTTNYDDNQNTILKRDATYGICPSFIHSAGAIKNGIYLNTAVNGSKALYESCWGGETDNSYPLPVWVALQILTYHEKANSVFEGDIKVADDNVTFGELFRLTAYEGEDERILLLRSGILDLMTGYVTGAMLEEVTEYDVVWELNEE